MSAAMVQAVLEAPKQVHGRALVEAQEAGPWQSPGGGSGSKLPKCFGFLTSQ